jgi:hypothetical protein
VSALVAVGAVIGALIAVVGAQVVMAVGGWPAGLAWLAFLTALAVVLCRRLGRPS